ncbi:MAG: hypothetical protein C0472_14130 [Erythrobacter sp.]|nr:hypothetical protein [Erythrobacter sp.]
MIWPFNRQQPDQDRLELWRSFPSAMMAEAKRAAQVVEGSLVPGHCTPKVSDSFTVRVGGETVWIPERLYFPQGYQSSISPDDPAWLAEQCLQTRSLDGYQRQRATRHVLQSLEPWSAPFVVALIGSYVIEILNDINELLTEDDCAVLRAFQAENPHFWVLTKSRVVSYWNVYYRGFHVGRRKKFSESDYVGRRLIDRMEPKA